AKPVICRPLSYQGRAFHSDETDLALQFPSPPGLREDETEMEDRLHGACEAWCPKWPARGLAANESVCALISMVVRSTARSIQRPDTLMQDRKATDRRRPLATHGRTIQLGQSSPLREVEPFADIRLNSDEIFVR